MRPMIETNGGSWENETWRQGVLTLVPLCCGDRTCAWDCRRLPAPLLRRWSSDTAPCRLGAAHGYTKAAKRPLRRDNAFLKEQPALQCWQLQGVFNEYLVHNAVLAAVSLLFLFYLDELELNTLSLFSPQKVRLEYYLFLHTICTSTFWGSLLFTLKLTLIRPQLWLLLLCSLTLSFQAFLTMTRQKHRCQTYDVRICLKFPATVAPSMFSLMLLFLSNFKTLLNVIKCCLVQAKINVLIDQRKMFCPQSGVQTAKKSAALFH